MILLKAIPRYGKRISLRAEQLTYAVGFVALFTFLIWITVFDVAKQVERRPVTSPDGLRPVRRPTVSVDVGGVLVGSAHPVVVQSMTNTDTADPDSTAIQVARLAHAGSQLVRVTVNTDEAAAAVPEMVAQAPRASASTSRSSATSTTTATSCSWTIPEMAAALDKYRINPGNVGSKHHDVNFQTIVRAAIDNDKPVRIGVNWGSLDQQLLTDLMEANARAGRAARRPRRDDRRDGRVGDALGRAGRGDGPRATTGSSCRRRCPASATSSTRTAGWRRAPTTRSTSA